MRSGKATALSERATIHDTLDLIDGDISCRSNGCMQYSRASITLQEKSFRHAEQLIRTHL